MEARDIAHVSGPVVAEDSRGLVMGPQEDDWPVGSLGKAFVDTSGQLLHAVIQLAIALNQRATGRGELNKGETPPKHWMPFKQTFHGEKTLLHSLGVIEPVDSHAEQGVRFESEFREDTGAALFRRWGGLEPMDGPFQRNGIRPN